MADSQDVSYSIVHALDAIVTPLVGTTYTPPEQVDINAVGANHTVPPITLAISRPLQKDLEDRLAAAKGMITVEPDDNDAPAVQYANEGRRQVLISQSPVTLTATPSSTAGNTSTIGGTITAGNIIGVQAGSLGAAYTVQGTDTPASVAAGLAAQAVAAGITASANGTTFSVDPGMGVATVQVGAPSTWLQAVSRRARSFDVLFWMPDPHLRHYLVELTDALFTPGQKLTMPDTSVATVLGTAGTLNFNTKTSDAAGRDNLFLARTRWLIEFTVTKQVTKAPIVAVTVALDAASIDLTAPLLASNL